MFKFVLFFSIGITLASCSYLPEVPAALQNLREENGDYAVYYSAAHLPGKAFLFVPGGLVDPYAYSCWIDQLVEQDTSIAVVLMKYPSNLAITNINKAFNVLESFEEINHWVIGGHSLGGVVAATLAHEHGELFDGLVLMGSWSREATDLSDWNGTVLSLFASEDKLATSAEVDENSGYLPPGITINSPDDISQSLNSTFYYEINGGNHSGFGCYGSQDGDGEGLITPEKQKEQMVEIMSSFFENIW